MENEINLLLSIREDGPLHNDTANAGRGAGNSCHHGDFKKENNLRAVKSVERKYGGEIGIYEIDFLSFHGDIYSSHDYNIKAIQNGSKLKEWIEFIIFQKRKILWLDIKENYRFSFNCGFERFDTEVLFSRLEEARDFYRTFDFDITPFVWLGCQEVDLHREIIVYNKRLQKSGKKKWEIILDMPSVESYIWRILTFSQLNHWIVNNIRNQYFDGHYGKYHIITIDKIFFYSREEILDFIQSLNLSKGMKIIVNSFPLSEPPLQLQGHHIITQYDYTTIK